MSRHDAASRFFRISAFAILIFAMVGTAKAVTISTVPVGSPGNAADPHPLSHYGAVPYGYNIGTYDVTNAQYVEFLNAKASSADPYGLWNSQMDPSNVEGAIARSASAPYTYTVKSGFANKPVVSASWYDAVRFINWLTNGQGNGDTESGTYVITGGGNNSGTVAVPDVTQRTTWATTNSFHWLLPSEDEWYKAAYYNALNSTYYKYPFQSDTVPAALAPPGNSNSGNFSSQAYNYDGNGSHLTDVGAYPNSLSPFGSFDMGGDVYQWDEGLFGSTARVLRGSYDTNTAFDSAATFRSDAVPQYEDMSVGFRVASVGSVPEPSTALLAGLAFGMIWRWKLSARHRIARRRVQSNEAGI